MVTCSIRLIFSIADIQSDQQPEFEEEGAEGVEEGSEEEDAAHSYPIRCSFSFTKVHIFASTRIDSVLTAMSCLVGCDPWRADDRRNVPGRLVHRRQHLVLQ